MPFGFINKKCVIFDYDGTIADTNSLHAAAFKKVFDGMGICGFQYDKYKGRKTLETFQDFFKAKNIEISRDKVKELVALKQKNARELMACELNAYDGAIEFIRELHKNQFKLVLASSSSRSGISLGLQKLGIYDAFIRIISGDDVEKAKPNPEIYIKALEAANVAPGEAVVIEDSISGAAAAVRAKLDVIIVNNENLRDQFYCTNFQELLENIKNEEDTLCCKPW